MADRESKEPTREEIVAKWRAKREQETTDEVDGKETGIRGFLADKRQYVVITTSIIIVMIIYIIGQIISGPTEPTTFEVYDNPQIGVTFSYPSDWDGTERIEQTEWSTIIYRDPSESGFIEVKMYDFNDPLAELSEAAGTLLAKIHSKSHMIEEISDIQVDLAKEITLMGMGADDYSACEIALRGTSEVGDKLRCNTIIVHYGSIRYIIMFACINSAYDTLEPAFDKLKETFVVR